MSINCKQTINIDVEETGEIVETEKEKMLRRLGKKLEERLCAVENWDKWVKTLMNTAKKICGVTNKHKKERFHGGGRNEWQRH